MTIPDLIALLEGAEQGSRELDAELSIAVRYIPYGPDHWLKSDEFPLVSAGYGQVQPMDTDGVTPLPGGGWQAPEFTDSVDAAIRLLKKVLPGWFWRCGATPLFPNGWAHVSRTDASNCDRRDEVSCSSGKAATPAIALCIATLRALQAKTGDRTE